MPVTIVGRGTATAAEVLATSTFSSDDGVNQAGTMPNQGSPTFTPTGSVQTGPAGYYGGLTVDAATVKTASGSVIASSTTASFNLLGGSTISLFFLTIPVPAGATQIIGVHSFGGTENFSSPLGYVDGQNASVLSVPAFDKVIAGGALSLTLSSIVVPGGSNGATEYYTVYYI